MVQQAIWAEETGDSARLSWGLERKTADTSHSVKQALNSYQVPKYQRVSESSPNLGTTHRSSGGGVPWTAGWADTVRISSLEHPKANPLLWKKDLFPLFCFPVTLPEAVAAQRSAALTDPAWWHTNQRCLSFLFSLHSIFLTDLLIQIGVPLVSKQKP